MLLQGPADVHQTDLTAAATAKSGSQPAAEAAPTGNDQQRETVGGPATAAAEHAGAPAAQPAAADDAASAPRAGHASEQHSHGALLAALAAGVAPASKHAPPQPGRLEAAQPQVCAAVWSVRVNSEATCRNGGTVYEGCI